MGSAWTFVVSILAASAPAPAPDDPARVSIGDTLEVFVDGYPGYGGKFAVQSDGSVYIPLVERVRVQGLTTAEVASVVARGFRRYLRRVSVSVLLSQQKVRKVAILGAEGGASEVEFVEGLDLRRTLATAGLTGNPEQLEVSVFRAGRLFQRVGMDALVRGDEDAWNGLVSPDDVLVVTKKDSVPVWVVGALANPGLVYVRPGTTVQQAIAAAGGLAVPLDVRPSEVRLSLRRADGTEASVAEDSAAAVHPGDTLYAQVPRHIRVSVLGWVNRVTDVRLAEGSKLADALAAAGGVKETAAARGVLLFRGAGMASASALVEGGRLEAAGIPLEHGDVVYVPPNQDRFYVVGRVGRPGSFPMEEGRVYRLSDALAIAEGVDALGTPRRMAIVRPRADGGYTTIPVDFDRWYRDARPEANPELQAGDFVFVSTARANAFDQVSRGISTFLILDALFRR